MWEFFFGTKYSFSPRSFTKLQLGNLYAQVLTSLQALFFFCLDFSLRQARIVRQVLFISSSTTSIALIYSGKRGLFRPYNDVSFDLSCFRSGLHFLIHRIPHLYPGRLRQGFHRRKPRSRWQYGCWHDRFAQGHGFRKLIASACAR